MRAYLVVALPAAALVASMLSGCSQSSSGQPVSAGTTTPHTSPASAPAALNQDEAQGALLTTAEVGDGFSQQSADNSDSPLPCTPQAPPLDKQVPPTVKVMNSFANAAGSAQFEEEIDGYGDVATAEHALSIGEHGLACSSATLTTGADAKIAVTISSATDLSAAVAVRVDKLEGWQIAAAKVREVIIVARTGPQLVVFSFTATAAATKNGSLPDTKTLITTALKKVQAA